MHVLQLFVAGNSTRSRTARKTIERLCDEHLRNRFDLEVIDVIADPERAEAASILATPTVVRMQPEPEIRIVGDLSDERAVLTALDVKTNK